MTVQDFYISVDGDYRDAMGRLLTEARICKYLFKLPGTEDYDKMNSSFAEKAWQDGFRFCHNIKGVSLNLSLTSLAEAAAVLCDMVRFGPPTEDITPALMKVNREYKRVLDNIAILKMSMED